MNSLRNPSKDCTKDIVYQFEQTQADLYRMQIANNRNAIVSKSIDIIIERFEMIKKLTQANIRFDWLKIQDEMDRLYKEDNSLTGYNILFDFKESRESNRALIKLTKI